MENFDGQILLEIFDGNAKLDILELLDFQNIVEEYQNHFIRHCPILSVTVPSHPSLSHLIRHLPISSVTRHLSVEKKGFIG